MKFGRAGILKWVMVNFRVMYILDDCLRLLVSYSHVCFVFGWITIHSTKYRYLLGLNVYFLSRSLLILTEMTLLMWDEWVALQLVVSY